MVACHASAKFYKDTPILTIPWLTPPRLDLCPPCLDLCLPRLTIYVLGKKWETSSGLASCIYDKAPVVVVEVQKQRHRDYYVQNIRMVFLNPIRHHLVAYSPTFQSVCESRFQQLFVPWSRYWCVERIQSRKTKYINASNCVVEVIAQFLVLLVAFLAPTEADLGGVTCTGCKTMH